MKKKIKYILQFLGPAILIYILFQIDFESLIKQIGLLKWHFLILVIITMILHIITRSLRWQTVLNSLGINISKIQCINLHWLGLFVGVITPGRLGELVKVYFLKNKGFDGFRSFFNIVVDRVIDILTLLSFGVLIFLFFLKDIGIYVICFGIIVLFVMILIFLLIGQKSFLNRFLPKDFKEYNRFTFNKLIKGIKGLRIKEIFSFLIYFILAWSFHFTARYFVALSLGLDLSFIDVSVASILMAIVVILPISVAGLGTREAVAIYVFSLFGLNKEIALIFSLLVFSMDLIVLVPGLIPYFKESSLIDSVK